jgi:hypothetical protein
MSVKCESFILNSFYPVVYTFLFKDYYTSALDIWHIHCLLITVGQILCVLAADVFKYLGQHNKERVSF